MIDTTRKVSCARRDGEVPTTPRRRPRAGLLQQWLEMLESHMDLMIRAMTK